MIALMRHENLSFAFQTPKRAGMDHPVAVALKRCAVLAFRLWMEPATRAGRFSREYGAGGPLGTWGRRSGADAPSLTLWHRPFSSNSGFKHICIQD
jgi:hypothetical protein